MIRAIFFAAVFATVTADVALSRNRTARVDTRIGTGGFGYGIGQLNPGPSYPFGAMRLGPDTSIGLEPLRVPFLTYGGYWYGAGYIETFSHTHCVGAGLGDYQNFGVMVTRQWDSAIIENCNFKSTFSHAEEVALPGYYAVNLETPNTYAELTVSGSHSGIHRYTCRSQWPSAAAAPCVLVIDICHGFAHKMLDNGGQCKEARVVNVSTSDGGLTYEIDAWVLNTGDFSGSGLNIYFHAVLTAATQGPSGRRSVQSQQGMWMDRSVLGSNSYASTSSGSLGLGFVVPENINGTVEFTLRAGISFVSSSNARLNLNTQQRPSGVWMSFEQSVQQTVNEWEAVLGTISYSGGLASSEWHTKVFDSTMYRLHLPPTTYSEVNGQYMGEDNKIHTVAAGHSHLSDFSIWDIYRTQAPLLAWTKPDVASDVANSMMEMYRVSGSLPKWPFANIETGCMVGHHSAVVLTDYVTKGLGGIDPQAILAAEVSTIGSQNSAMSPLGYIPLDSDRGGTSDTLDYSIDAAAVANLARFLGNASVAQTFGPIGQNYRNVFDTATSYFCPKWKNGTFACTNPLNPYPWEDHFTEGSAAEYRWYAPQDPYGLVSLYPSNASFAQDLNDFFQYTNTFWIWNTSLPNELFWAGNEPDIQTQVMFNWAGNEFAHLTQYWFPALLDFYYTPWPSGLPGNDDYGAMSAWCAWGYIGVFPMPPTDEYALFTPRFDSIDVRVDANGFIYTPWRKTVSQASSGSTTVVQIRCYNRPATGVAYVANISVNGVPLATPIVRHQQLLATSGGKPTLLEFYLASEPSVFGQQLPSLGGPKPFVPDVRDPLRRTSPTTSGATVKTEEELAELMVKEYKKRASSTRKRQ